MKNLQNIRKHISTTDISFLMDINKSINIDKTGKCYYFKIFTIDLDQITNFINNLDYNEIYLIKPIISINCRIHDPHITLSKQFLVSCDSNPILITNFLIDQLGIARKDFGIEEGNYQVIFY